MPTNLVTAPTELVIPVCEMRELMGVDADHDTNLRNCIMDATDYVQRATRRQFLTATFRKSFSGFPLGSIPLEYPPLQSVTSITYVDNNGTTQTWAASNYTVDTYGLIGSVEPAYNCSYPTVREIPNAVQITYKAGYLTPDSVPGEAKRCIRFLVGHYFENREGVVTGTIATLPLAIESLIIQLSIPEII